MPAEDDNMNLHLAIVLWCQHATQPCFANDAKFWEPPSWNWKNLGKLGFTEKENCFVNNQEKPNPIQPLHKRIQFPTVKIWISSAKHKSNKLGRPLTHHPQQPRTTHACLPHPSFEPSCLRQTFQWVEIPWSECKPMHGQTPSTSPSEGSIHGSLQPQFYSTYFWLWHVVYIGCSASHNC